MRLGSLVGGAVVVVLAGVVPAGAQPVTNFQIEGATLNAGGRPSGGVVAQSLNFQITLDAVGEAVPALAASSLNFGVSGGVTGAYAPAAEVSGVSFGPSPPAGSFSWDRVPTAVSYNVYRGGTNQLPGTFGSCLVSNLVNLVHSDPAVPAAKTGYFYLVTGENRLGEQGIKGYQSNGALRTSLPACP